MSKSDKNNNKKAKATASAAVAETKSVTLFGKQISYQNLTLIITAAVLSVLFIVGMVFIIINEVQKNEDKNFDYFESDLAKYITMDENLYKNYKISLDVAKPRDVDVEAIILSLLADKKGDAKYEGKAQYSGKIDAGDEVYIYYRGYLLDSDGKEQPADSMCNFANATDGEYTPAKLEIGSNELIPGFEVELAGKTFTSANNFVRITTGTVKEGQILYISYIKSPEGSTSDKDKETTVGERVVLSDGKDKIDAKYGEGFYDKLVSLPVGVSSGAEFVGKEDGKNYKYTDLKIAFATECEKEGNYILVNCYFPDDYQIAERKNRNARFEVYVQKIVEYEEVEFTDAFVESNLGKEDFGLSAEDLEGLEGTLTEKVRKYVKNALDKEYEERYHEALEKAIWSQYHKANVTQIKKFPKTKVDNVYNEYFNDVVAQFEASEGVIETALGQSKTCETLDEFAIIYLGLEYTNITDWREHLRVSVAENLVKERLILFYLIEKENIEMTEEKVTSQIEKIKKEYLDEYISQYLVKNGLDKKDYSETEWAEFEQDRSEEIFGYYDYDYFKEQAYYEIALETFMTWPEITTLDDLTISTQ